MIMDFIEHFMVDIICVFLMSGIDLVFPFLTRKILFNPFIQMKDFAI